jgi:PiT family inorganic phosphate transporter
MMAVVLNFCGVLIMTFINAQVAETISNIVSFDGGAHDAQIALAAALFSIVAWSVGAWYFGIPTSESHSLIAGITGAAMAMGGLGAVSVHEWSKVFIGLVVSSVIGFGGGFGVARLIQKIFAHVNRQKANQCFTVGQAFSAAANAFLHGAQDGQKFMGVFMLTLFYNGFVERDASGGFTIPLWVMIMCSLIMGLGTSVGGMRIIKAVGMDMVKLEKYQGFSADLSAAFCLLASSLFGIPVSTTHTKTTAIMGVGAARRVSSVDWSIVKEMVLAWVLTFPECGLIAYLITKLFIRIF